MAPRHRRSGQSRAAGPCATRLLAAGLLVLLAAGCATYSRKLADLRPQLSRGAHAQALETIERKAGGKDALLADLERGLILRAAGRYAESNEAFAAAERTAEDLVARSLSEGALSLLTNDLAISYRARPYELVMVPYYRALNYLALGQRESAMVEARKTSLLLSRHVDATVMGIARGPVPDLERTRNDPFMLYFAGMLYDADGELNDAFIAYRNAAVAYEDLHELLDLQIPRWLAADLERTGRWLGFADELAQLREACPAVFAAGAGPKPAASAADGEVVLLIELGFVPIKQEARLSLPILESDAYQDNAAWAWDLSARAAGAYVRSDAVAVKYWLTIAVPQLQDTPAVVQRVRIVPPGGGTAVSQRAHHPAAVARVTFAAEQPTILFKTALRGLTKYLASRKADDQGKVYGLLSNILGAVTETADTRNWLTLPEQVHLVRLRLPGGRHDLRLELQDVGGRPLGALEVADVAVRRGEWTFVSQRVFDR